MWLIYGVMCGLFGGVAAVVGSKISRSNGVRLAISATAIILSAIISGSYLRPNIYAAEFEVGMAEILGGLPKKIDDTTVLDKFTVAGDTVRYEYTILIEIRDLEATKARLERSIFRKEACQGLLDVVRPFASNIIYSYETNLGAFNILLTDETCG